MVKVLFTRVIAALLPFVLVACGEYLGESTSIGTTAGQINDGLGGCAGIDLCLNVDIEQDTTLEKGTYVLAQVNNRAVPYVKIRDGATLTIEPGTTILGQSGTALIVTRGSRIISAGTQDEPIVYTSEQTVGERQTGSWGGVLLLGAAPANTSGARQQFEALPANDTDGQYGGDDPQDNSGVLRYSRIEFGGYTYAENKEFNGLSLCAVGNGTTIDHVQVHRSSDDGFEFFGGNPDLKYVISSQNEDDGFDTDQGFTGRVQFLIVQHINGKTSDPNGYESDNGPTEADYNLSPRTGPTIYNATLIGSPTAVTTTAGSSYGMVARRGTSGHYYNHIIMSFQHSAIDVRNAETVALFPTDFFFKSSLFFDNAGGANWDDETGTDASGTSRDNDSGFIEATQFLGASLDNAEADPHLRDPSNSTSPDFTPTTLTVGATPEADTNGFFDTSANFVGAVGTNDWTRGWTSFPTN